MTSLSYIYICREREREGMNGWIEREREREGMNGWIVKEMK